MAPIHMGIYKKCFQEEKPHAFNGIYCKLIAIQFTFVGNNIQRLIWLAPNSSHIFSSTLDSSPSCQLYQNHYYRIVFHSPIHFLQEGLSVTQATIMGLARQGLIIPSVPSSLVSQAAEGGAWGPATNQWLRGVFCKGEVCCFRISGFIFFFFSEGWGSLQSEAEGSLTNHLRPRINVCIKDHFRKIFQPPSPTVIICDGS